ncbi:hypothetical protein LBMAG42_08780 [Deltaproteobacteria bacterium]|nr:hypothetical protein LBMAG42_08780 [Deltaproteobacteria bacterium]
MKPTPVQLMRTWEVKRRRVVVALSVMAAACLGGSWFLPWWTFRLFAPQYPKGLSLVIHLTGVQGDVAEIDTINHYIGMHSLADSALLERAASHWIVGLTAAAVVVLTFLAGRKLGWLGMVIGLGLPLGFVIDTTYWMYKSGHDLDDRAPITLKPFMPTVIGDGKVGQFLTEAWPAVGFWLAVTGVVLLAIATWQRARVCRVCPTHDECGTTCPHRLLGHPS